MSVAFVHDHKGEFLGMMPRNQVWLFAKPKYTFTYDNIEGSEDEMEHSCTRGDIVFCTIEEGKLIGFSKEQGRHNARITLTMAKYYKRYPEEDVKSEFFSPVPVLENALEVWTLGHYPLDRSIIRVELKLVLLRNIIDEYQKFTRNNCMLDNFYQIELRLKKLFPKRITEFGKEMYFICA